MQQKTVRMGKLRAEFESHCAHKNAPVRRQNGANEAIRGQGPRWEVRSRKALLGLKECHGFPHQKSLRNRNCLVQGYGNFLIYHEKDGRDAPKGSQNLLLEIISKPGGWKGHLRSESKEKSQGVKVSGGHVRMSKMGKRKKMWMKMAPREARMNKTRWKTTGTQGRKRNPPAAHNARLREHVTIRM